MMKISLILEAVNRMSAPMRAVTQSLEKMAAVASAVARRVGASMTSMYDKTRDAAYHFRALAGAEGMGRAARGAAYLREQVSGLTGGLTILKYASLAAGIGLGEEFVRGVFKAGGEMQTMLVTLTKLEGGATKAKASMAWMQGFAMGPGAAFSMPDIMRAYQMAQNFGMNPKGGSLASVADMAAGERRPMAMILNAIKDAMEGTSTRPLANLGIKLKQGKGADGQDTYLYSIDNQQMSATSAKAPDAVLATLMKIINAKYFGLATAQAKTVPGGIAQMQKLLFLFEGKVAGAGVFDWALKQMNRFFAYVRSAWGDGSLDRLAKRISDFMTGTGNKIIAFVASTDWAAVGRDIRSIGTALVIVAGGVKLLAGLGGGGISGLFNLWVATKIYGISTAVMGLVAPLITVSAALAGFDIAAWPIAVVIGAIGLLAAAGWLLYANWNRISGWWKRLWGGMSTGTRIALILAAINPLFAVPALIEAAWSGLAGFFGRLWAGIKALVPSPSDLIPKLPSYLTPQGNAGIAHLLGRDQKPSAAPLLRAPGGTAHARGPDPKAHVTVEFVGNPTPMQVKRIQATGMDVDVKRGRVMGQPG